MPKNLPVHELRINEDEDSFVSAIALVEYPAIESDFIAFSQTKEQYSFSSDDKMELLGAAMIPDQLIYRKDKDGAEYNVRFTANTIRQISQVYFKKGFQSDLNLDHTTTPAKSFVFQSYIVDSKFGMNSPKGLDLPDGSWVVGVKVTDKEVWNDIKAGKRKGFSVEGMFQFFNKVELKQEQELIDQVKGFQAIINKLSKK